MKSLLNEPLLHFVLIGAALFGAEAWLNRGAPDIRAAHQIRISANDVQWLAHAWARQWQRDPTRDELRGLLTEFLKEELLAREGHALGLDENDTVVRRRLAQKVEFLVQDTARMAEPSEDELRQFHATNWQAFAEPARISFTQMYFNRVTRLDAGADARAILATMTSTAAPAGEAPRGDALMIDAELRNADEEAVAAQFGGEFARRLFALEPGAWQGPIESAYGLHLVRVFEKRPARQRDFGEVRAQVLANWREQRRKQNEEQYLAALVKKYDVVLDGDARSFVGPLNGSLPGWMTATAERLG